MYSGPLRLANHSVGERDESYSVTLSVSYTLSHTYNKQKKKTALIL